ncbi:hypothetical protein PLANTIT3_80103 [Plantibacter sp. T3]|nr:hypothetical protein PLANTIT3_80103 [Plantibacter sp. T3]
MYGTRSISTNSNRAKLLAGTAGVCLAGLVSLATLSVVLVGGYREVAQVTSKAEPAAAEPAAAVVAIEHPTEPVVSTQPGVAPQEPVSTTASKASTPVEVAPAVEHAPHADQMTAAGIAEADQTIAEALIFRGGDWYLWRSNVGRPAMLATDPVARFTVVKNYVVNVYGTWSAASAQAASSGGLW